MFRKRIGLAAILGLLISALAFVGVQAASTLGEQVPAEKSPLRVLYAGKPGSEREADFAKFLGERFSTVKTGNYEKFSPDDAEDFDVVIFDWPSVYPRDAAGKVDFKNQKMLTPKPPEIDGKFSRPTILIGAAGGGLAQKLNTAINWKCLCMENEAHDVNTKHEIFQGPALVTMTFELRKKPHDYFLSPDAKSLDETIEVWKVQEKTFPEVDPGLVASRENFTNTKGAEVISGGINGKGPTSVAIGRHGNFLLWGFSGQPSEMTESGRNAFANSICYIDKFDGQTAGPVKTTYGSRDSWLDTVCFLRATEEAYINELTQIMAKQVEKMGAPQEMLDQIGDDPAAYFRQMMEPHVKQTLEQVPQAVRDECGDDPEKLIQYYRDNLEYLRNNGEGVFVVDEEARELGVSNRSPQLLETCVAMLEKGDRPELAEGILERYTGQTLDGAAAWREWVGANREKVSFDEGVGKFVVE